MGAENSVAKPKANITPRSYYNITHLHASINDPAICIIHKPYSSKIQPKQDFKGQSHYGKFKGQFKVTPWHCQSIPPNQCPYQV